MLPLPPPSGADGVDVQGNARVGDASRWRIVASGADEYALAPSGTPKGSLVSDGAGGYVLTIGDLTGAGEFLRLGAGDLTIL